jgi:hypothetical protein
LTYFISENKMNIANVVAMVARIGAAVERFNIAGRAFGKRRGGQAPSNGVGKRRKSSKERRCQKDSSNVHPVLS